MPVQPLDAAVQTWRRICTNPLDRKVEEELRAVSAASHHLPCPALPPPLDPAGPALIGCTHLNRSLARGKFSPPGATWKSRANLSPDSQG